MVHDKIQCVWQKKVRAFCCILAILCLNCSHKQDGINVSFMEERSDGLTYKQDTKKPFTGAAVKLYPNGKPEYRVEYVNGKAHGSSVQWWENGQKSSVVEFQQGKIVSKKQWDVNGNLIN